MLPRAGAELVFGMSKAVCEEHLLTMQHVTVADRVGHFSPSRTHILSLMLPLMQLLVQEWRLFLAHRHFLVLAVWQWCFQVEHMGHLVWACLTWRASSHLVDVRVCWAILSHSFLLIAACILDSHSSALSGIPNARLSPACCCHQDESVKSAHLKDDAHHLT